MSSPQTYSEYETQQRELALREREARMSTITSGAVSVTLPYEVNAEKWKQLTRPFEENQIGKLPKGKGSGDDIQCSICGGKHKERGVFHVDYISHAFITERLNEVDPSWELIPGKISFDDDLVYMPVTLRVLGVVRHEVGCADKEDGEWPKMLYSDSLTRVAMRFGIGLTMWQKLMPAQEASQRRSSRPVSSPVQQQDPTVAALLEVLKADVAQLDLVGAASWTIWKGEHDGWWKSSESLVAARDFVMGLLTDAASSEPF
jgi:hypothetical protein